MQGGSVAVADLSGICTYTFYISSTAEYEASNSYLFPLWRTRDFEGQYLLWQRFTFPFIHTVNTKHYHVPKVTA
jgi:hypothetical protein